MTPVKENGKGKTRLAPALAATERTALVDAMLLHGVDAAAGASLIARTLRVGPARHGLDADIPLIGYAGKGLNAALESALIRIAGMDGRADRLIVIAADLPRVTSLDLDLLAEAPYRTVSIAPDRHGPGTHALSLPLPIGKAAGRERVWQ